jgi:hypothetical protein
MMAVQSNLSSGLGIGSVVEGVKVYSRLQTPGEESNDKSFY